MVMFTSRMAKRIRETVAGNVRAAVAGVPNTVLAQAADTDPDAFAARLAADDPTIADLIGVGGFLHVHPSVFLKGATK